MKDKVNKVLKNELLMYLVFGILTTVVYFVTRFLVIAITENSLIAVSVAQITAILFAFITNKYFVFHNKESKRSVVIKQFMIFFSGRLFVFGLDLAITFLAVQKYGDFLIRLFSIDQLPFNHFLFNNVLTRNFIGTPKLLNEFIWALVVQVLAIIINYLISKKRVFKKD